MLYFIIYKEYINTDYDFKCVSMQYLHQIFLIRLNVSWFEHIIVLETLVVMLQNIRSTLYIKSWQGYINMGFSELFRPAGKCFASEACPCRGIDNLTAAFARNEYVKSNDLCIISAILIILFETIDTTLSDRLKVKLSAQSVIRPFSRCAQYLPLLSSLSSNHPEFRKIYI